MTIVRGFGDETYGESFADVYDDWYDDLDDVEAATGTLLALAATPTGRPARIVELGVGTGRLAIPLAAAGAEVIGLDTSAAMLARLAAKPGGSRVHCRRTDMVVGLHDLTVRGPAPVELVVAAYNTLFNLPDVERQAACFRAAAVVLAPGGHLVVEGFLPVDGAGPTSAVRVRTIDADRVVLAVDRSDPATQTAEGQYIELSETGGVRLRPWRIRWSTPDELDRMADAAGLTLAHRWAGLDRAAFDPDGERHVSVYRR